MCHVEYSQPHAACSTGIATLLSSCTLTVWHTWLQIEDHQPAPMLEQPLPLRRPPSSPFEVAQSVHGKVLQMTNLAAAPMHDMAKIQTMLHDDAAQVRCCHVESRDSRSCTIVTLLFCAVSDEMASLFTMSVALSS